MNIGSKNGYPSSALSNFAPHKFKFDGVECASVEGVLQSLKFDKEHIQVEVCKLVGLAAKRRGSERNYAWKRVQTLWWKGNPINRHSEEYQLLLDRIFDTVAEQNAGFRKALLATENAVLKHTIGRTNPKDSVLTQTEFVRRLTKIRNKLQNDNH